MKKILTVLLTITMSMALFVGSGQAVTLKTISTFAGGDRAAQTYYDLLEQWESETGNTVEDYSDLSSEEWKSDVLRDVQAGYYDVVFYYAVGADSQPMLPYVVSMNEILETYPDAPLTVNPLMTEGDGKVYAIPVRPFWEGLICNTDVFEQHGVELPTTWEQMKTAIETFKAAGVVPIATGLTELTHYITEVAILASGPAADYAARPKTAAELPESWVKGMELIRELYQMGAFPEQVGEMTEDDVSDMFLAKQAAMTIDGTWFANAVPADSWNTTVVIPFPTYTADADPNAVVGGISMGFYLTRSAWDNTEKRASAVSLLEYLTRPEAAAKLGVFYEGRLLESSQQMVGSASGLYAPISDSMYNEARIYWYSEVLPMARGEADPRAVMTQVIEMGAFTKNEEGMVED